MKKVILIMLLGMFITFVQAQQTKTESKATPKKTEIKTTELSKEISTYITKNYAGFKILKAYKVDTKGEITYEVSVVKAAEKNVLYFDSEGAFTKKVPVKATTTTNKKTTTTTAPKKTTATKAKADSTKVQ